VKYGGVVVVFVGSLMATALQTFHSQSSELLKQWSCLGPSHRVS